ncbi:elongator complex protein 5-like [Amphibalanus amphitrite]|uniref:elongator complex protein 5-like n=1 Tax=Amphibalanus amphitrite TaxID=1232801 RepID=UPI001C8FB9E3|nr:elongator complex protein 5-like [Amphibalanus amphitrite]
MFEKILSVKPEGTSILIIDAGDGSYRHLLSSYVQHRQQQQVSVSWVPCGQSADELPGTSGSSAGPIEQSDSSDQDWETAEDIGRQLEAALPLPGPPARLLVVRDASRLLHWLGPTALCRLIRRSCDRGHQVVLGVLEEAVPEEHLSQLRHYSTHVLSVEGAGRELTVSGTYRFKAGKVETATERVSLSADLVVTRVEPARPVPAVPAAARAAPAAPLAPGLTTFSLQLSETEKQSRDRLVLPYLRPEQGGGDSGPGTGQIFYQPDAADDWDEEDPDDDLDI